MDADPTDPMHFREVLGQYPTGVCIVTAIHADGYPVGMAVGTFTSVSLNPPLVAFLPDQKSSSWAKIATSGHFCVNVLGAGQEDLCRVFSSRVPDKFEGQPWRPAPSGSPILDGAVAWVDCALDTAHEAGDHHIVIGRVTALDVQRPSLPLLFYRGGYGQFTPLSFTTMDSDVLDSLGMVDLVRPAMESVADELGVDCMASLRVGDDCVYVARAGSRGDVRTSTHVGRRVPLRPPVGSTLVAWADPADQAAWIARAGEHSGWTPGFGQLVLQRIREQGYVVGLGHDLYEDLWSTLSAAGTGRPSDELAVTVDKLSAGFGQEPLDPQRAYEVGMLTAPVLGPEGLPVLQLSLVGLPSPLTGREIQHRADRLMAACASASACVGGRVLTPAG